MTTQASLNETMQGKSNFIHFEDRASEHPFVEKVWRCHSDRADTFLSIAANNFEVAITRLGGKSFLTLRGPETTATTLDCPAEGEWIGIRFKVGTFMPRFLPGSLRDHKDVTLPPATGHSFWLNGSALEYPDFDNAETFVKRLAKSGILSRDPIVDDTLLRRPGELCLRSVQRHFLRSTGVPYATFLRCSPFFGQEIVLLKVDRRRRACGNCEKAERSCEVFCVSFHRPWCVFFLLLFSFWAFSTRKFCARIA
jgi:hypothetical protein